LGFGVQLAIDSKGRTWCPDDIEMVGRTFVHVFVYLTKVSCVMISNNDTSLYLVAYLTRKTLERR